MTYIYYLKYFILTFLFVSLTGFISKAYGQQIEIENIDSNMIKEPKPIIILLTTDWCTYCAMQQKQITKSKLKSQQLNSTYFIQFNPEENKTIIFNQKKYPYTYSGYQVGINELTHFLSGNNKISYPYWVILDKHYKIVQHYQGVLKQNEIDAMISNIDKVFIDNKQD